MNALLEHGLEPLEVLETIRRAQEVRPETRRLLKVVRQTRETSARLGVVPSEEESHA